MSVLHTNPRRFARIASVLYLLVFLFGITALSTSGLAHPKGYLPAQGDRCAAARRGTRLLTYIHPPLAKRLGALAMAPGMIGEGALTFWLLAAGVDPERWRARSTQSTA